MRLRTPPIALVALVLALGGCGGGSGGSADDDGVTTPAVTAPEGELSVAQAKEQGGTGLKVNGVVYVRLEEWSFCNALDQTVYPPGCLEPTLKIANPDALADLKLEQGIGQGAGLQWSARRVSLTGDVEGDAFQVSEIATE